MRWILGLLLWPTAGCSLGAAAWTLGRLFSQPRLSLPFLLGFIGYPLLHFYRLPFRSKKLYVMGHELTHALAAWMSGAKVLGFSVKSESGHVDVSHSNAWIALAPYVVPIYALVLLLIYRVLLGWSHSPFIFSSYFQQGFFFVMGTALAFHAVETLESLWSQHQTDLDSAGGVLFSLAVIALVNGLILILTLKCLFPKAVSLPESCGMIYRGTSRFWTSIFLMARRSYRKYSIHGKAGHPL